MADRTRDRECSQVGQLNPGRDRECHILTGLAATGVGGEQAQGGLQGPIHPRQGEAQEIAHLGVCCAAIPQLDRRNQAIATPQGGFNPGLVPVDQGIAVGEALVSGGRKRAGHRLAEVQVAEEVGQVEGQHAVVVATDRLELAGHLGRRIGGDHLHIQELAATGAKQVRGLEVQAVASGLAAAGGEFQRCGPRGPIVGDAEPTGLQGLALLPPGPIDLALQPVDAGDNLELVARVRITKQTRQGQAEAAAGLEALLQGAGAGGSRWVVDLQHEPVHSGETLGIPGFQGYGVGAPGSGARLSHQLACRRVPTQPGGHRSAGLMAEGQGWGGLAKQLVWILEQAGQIQAQGAAGSELEPLLPQARRLGHGRGALDRRGVIDIGNDQPQTMLGRQALGVRGLDDQVGAAHQAVIGGHGEDLAIPHGAKGGLQPLDRLAASSTDRIGEVPAWGQVGVAEQGGEVQPEGLVLADFDRPGGRRQHGGRLARAAHHPAQALAGHHTLAIGGLDQQIPGAAIGAAGGAHQVTIAEAQPGSGLAQGVGEGEAVLERVTGIGVLETGAQVQVHAAAEAQAAIAQAGSHLGTVIDGSHQGLHRERGTGFLAGAPAVAADRLHLQGHGSGLVRTGSPGHPRPIGGPQGERCRPIACR